MGVCTFNESKTNRQAKTETYDEQLVCVDMNNVAGLSKESLSYALCKFLAEVTKKKRQY